MPLRISWDVCLRLRLLLLLLLLRVPGLGCLGLALALAGVAIGGALPLGRVSYGSLRAS
jgi:hypothetical protein